MPQQVFPSLLWRMLIIQIIVFDTNFILPFDDQNSSNGNDHIVTVTLRELLMQRLTVLMKIPG